MAKKLGVTDDELDLREEATKLIIVEAAAEATDVIDEGRALVGGIGFLWHDALPEVRYAAAAQARHGTFQVNSGDYCKHYLKEVQVSMARKLQRIVETCESPMRSILHDAWGDQGEIHARHRSFVKEYGWPLEAEHRSFFDSFSQAELESMVLAPESFHGPDPAWTAYLGAYNLAQVGQLWSPSSRLGADPIDAGRLVSKVLPEKMLRRVVEVMLAYQAHGPHPRHVFNASR